MHTITLTRENIANADNNSLVYNIPGSRNLEGCEIALSNLYMYYSWENINASPLNNNIFYVKWPALQGGFGGIDIAITIPAGIYEVADLNAYLQQFSIDNNLYLENSTTGEYVYFIQMQVNATRYSIQFNSFTLPIATTAGYTEPTGGFCNSPTLFGSGQQTGVSYYAATTGDAPGFMFPANFSSWAGFEDGATFPVATGTGQFPTGNVSYLSTKAPQINPNPVIYLNCDKIMNTFANPQTFMYPIPAKVEIGALLQIEPPEYSFNKMMPGQFGTLRFSFTNANGQPIKIIDPNIIITCVIRDHEDKSMNMGASNVGGISSSMETLRHSHKPVHGSVDSQHSNHMRRLHAHY